MSSSASQLDVTKVYSTAPTAMIANSDLTTTISESMNHEGMNHEGMNHDGMNHEGMNHDGMNHDVINHEGINHSSEMLSADLSDSPSSPDSPTFDDHDILAAGVIEDEITAQLAASGPVGVAAAAAIATAKKRKRPHSFETNPSIRKRQQTRLLRKMRALIDEYTTRVGQQAVVLQCTPGKPHNNFKVFGAKPLEGVIRNCRAMIMQELEQALAQQAPPPPIEDPSLHELPPLMVDGIPTPVEKMTQAQLRTFIPLMLKYSTGRGKPGWGKESTRPPWWPKDLPWANVRSDVRTEEEKHRVSWTHALRQIVINCYKHHGRDDLLPQFHEVEDKKSHVITHYTPTMVQTISNPDGTVSIIHVDPTNAVVTLPDGTQAQVQAVSAIETTQGDAAHSVQTLSQAAHHHHGVITTQSGAVGTMNMNIDLNGEAGSHQLATLAEATINQDGQLILTGEDGSQAFPVSGMVTIPVSMYQTVVANISQLTGVTTSDGSSVSSMQVAAMQHPTVLQAAAIQQSSEMKIEPPDLSPQVTDITNVTVTTPSASPHENSVEILSVNAEQTQQESTGTTEVMDMSNGSSSTTELNIATNESQ